MPSSPEPRDLLGSADPAREFWDAHERGQRIALRTSGTTASPRAVVRTTSSWVDSFDHVTELTGITDSSDVWIPGPTSATMNLFAHLHASFAGASVVASPGEATHAVLTPLGLRRALSDEGWGRTVTAVVAGDALDPSLAAQARERGLRIHHYYGASELSFVAWGIDGEPMLPFPGVECRVDGDGVIWARSPYLSEGYLEGSSPGSLRWDGDGFATVGDRGAWQGESVVVHGRGEDAITTAGVTFAVADVEVLLRSTARGPVVVIGVPDARLGAIVTVVVTDPADMTPLRDIAATLPAAMRPRRWEVVREIPMTPAGKPDRNRLARLLTVGDPQQVGRWPRD